MKSQKLLMGGLVFGLIVGFAAPAVWAGEVKNREENQQDRVAQGVNSGQLTAGETAKLEKGEAKIEHDRQKALADGTLTHKEKRKLNHEENRESKKIFRAKHNKKTQ